MKKIVSMMLVLSMVLGITACSSDPAETSQSTSTQPSQSTAPSGGEDGIIRVTDGEPLSLTVAVHSGGEVMEAKSMKYMAEILEERSGGNVTPEVFTDGLLGNESDILEQVELNTVQIATTGFAGLDKYISSVNCWSVPYLFPDVEAVKASLEGPIGDAARAKFEEKGIIYVGNLFRGNRQLTSTKKVETPEDLKGLKLRLPDTAAWVTVWEAMGAITSPIASSEVFSALQTGVVDGQENPISSCYAKALWEVQDYIIMTNHIVDFLVLTASKDFYDSLSDDYKALFDQCMQESMDWNYEQTLATEESLLAEMVDKGMEVVEVDTALFAEVAQPGFEKVAENWEDWVLEAALEYAK
ncbi:MAG: DctP family TRAP transporter solute-binding subunit [Eubacteriales bacterium]|jgi:tripartite ATP-independent transporter DctP family solute receptor